MTYKVNDYIDILHRFNRIGMLDYANTNTMTPESYRLVAKRYKHMTPEEWRGLTRWQRKVRIDYLKLVLDAERSEGITL